MGSDSLSRNSPRPIAHSMAIAPGWGQNPLSLSPTVTLSPCYSPIPLLLQGYYPPVIVPYSPPLLLLPLCYYSPTVTIFLLLSPTITTFTVTIPHGYYCPSVTIATLLLSSIVTISPLLLSTTVIILQCYNIHLLLSPPLSLPPVPIPTFPRTPLLPSCSSVSLS